MHHVKTLALRCSAALAVTSLLIGVAATSVEACTRVLWNDNGFATLATRSMDWEPETSRPKLVVSPRGVSRVGNQAGPATISDPNPARWRAKYGSVTVTSMGVGVADGINEKGLAAHALWLNEANFGARDVTEPGLHDGLWVQYVLDNAATVNDVVAMAPNVQVTPLTLSDGLLIPLGLAVEDASGDSAVLQYIDGKLTVFHGRQYDVVSNDPAYGKALELVNPDGYANATRNDPLPGNTNSRDRFVRGTFYLDFLRRTKPSSVEEAKAALMSVARNVSDPIGAPMDTPGSRDETDYRTLSDLTNRTYAYEPTRRLGLLTTNLNRLNFKAGQPIRVFDPTNPKINGDITGLYEPVKKTKG